MKAKRQDAIILKNITIALASVGHRRRNNKRAGLIPRLVEGSGIRCLFFVVHNEHPLFFVHQKGSFRNHSHG